MGTGTWNGNRRASKAANAAAAVSYTHLDVYKRQSEAQLVLLRSLFAAGGSGVPVTAVGDPNQSIYGWRGASATTLTRFPAEFTDGSPTPVRQLATTWRLSLIHI